VEVVVYKKDERTLWLSRGVVVYKQGDRTCGWVVEVVVYKQGDRTLLFGRGGCSI